MAFVDRIVEHPGRFRLTQVDEDVFDLTREEGEVTEAGTPLDAEHLNGEIAQGVIDRFVTGSVVKDNVSIATGATSGTLNIAMVPRGARMVTAVHRLHGISTEITSLWRSRTTTRRLLSLR